MPFVRLVRCRWLALLVISTTAAAQTPRELPSFELEHLSFNPSQRESLLIGSGDLLPAGQFRGSLIAHYQHNPLLLFQVGAAPRSVVRSRVTAHLLAAYGITRWLEVGLQLPVVVFQSGDQIPELTPLASAGLGTPWLQARLALLSEEQKRPIDLAFQLGLGLPLGSSAALTRDASVTVNPRLGAGKRFGLIRAGAEVGALIRQGRVLSPENPTVGDEVGSVMQLGASAATTNEGLRGELTVLGWVPFTRTGASAEVLLGARYLLGPVELFAIGGPGFGRTPGTPAFRVMLGAGLSLPNRRCVAGEAHEPKDCPQLDLDLDQIVNADDQCPREPGTMELSGCPDRDPDQDGVRDPDDGCPQVSGPKENGGCPQVDSDGDGLFDPEDGCPKVAGPRQNKGCPWADTDADGVADRDDGCPKVAGPSENKGCPWPDTDSDGLLDPDDACPAEAGPADRKGCPVRDADADTVPDELDNCPKVKGLVENQGCPKELKQLVVITREKLVIKEKVFFDTGKATIKPKSFPLLTQVAQVLNEHPEIEQIRIEGHTDNVGKPETNRKLSQRRAESVRDFLTGKGVAASRLEAQGFGPDRPADVNTSAVGRENNRRVEFVVVTAPKTEVHEVTP
ncbi:MAG: OmpA/MotB [Myxococcaceae bacterium]|nr:OmpA/MotB [Myxococcaceae bacterium]